MSTTEMEKRAENEVVPAEPAEAKHRISPELNDRVLSPLLLPLGAILFVALYTVNLSRVFLSGTGNPAIFVAGTVTLVILGGAATISASRGARSHTVGLAVAALIALVMMSGLVTLGASQEKKVEASGYIPPKGPAVATVAITAGPPLAFAPSTADTKAGINQFDLTAAGTPHTFQFHEVSGFVLTMNKVGKYAGKVDLKPGTYHYYCGIPGHEAAGMKGVLTVTAG